MFALSENEATCGGASVGRRGVRGDREEAKPEGRRTLLNSVSACCSTSKSPKFRGEKACGMCRPWRGGKRRVAVRRASGEGRACGRVRVETAYRGRTARVGCSKKTQTYLRDVVRGRDVLHRARSPARGELIHAQLLFLPGAVAASGVALARDEHLGRRRLRELPGRIRERHDRAHGLEVEVLRHRAHGRDAARRVRGTREERRFAGSEPVVQRVEGVEARVHGQVVRDRSRHHSARRDVVWGVRVIGRARCVLARAGVRWEHGNARRLVDKKAASWHQNFLLLGGTQKESEL